MYFLDAKDTFEPPPDTDDSGVEQSNWSVTPNSDNRGDNIQSRCSFRGNGDR